MTWKIRHQGSPEAVEGLTLAQVVEGLQEERWKFTDEIMGPNDRAWTPIESHPQLEEVVAELEHPVEKPFEAETGLDMNPLIDVCLVLLIFFILTTSYAAAQKVLEMPAMSKEKTKPQPPSFTPAEVKKFTIRVQARVVDGKPVLKVEDQTVDQADLLPAIKQWVQRTGKTEMLIDASDDVSWGTLVAIQDAAKGAGVTKAHIQAKPGGGGGKPAPPRKASHP
ncbi:MAG: biopolymer transporter ExbD [Planctomycetes bacterium]|nr:biopolymer transporter ExbD [Planctomycetota bacterium]